MKTAVLKIYGDIGTDVTDVMVSDFLDKNKAAEDITVRINSCGGDVTTGWNIYDYLKSSGKNIKTVGEGKVYSIATVIFLAGSDREILPNSDGVIHMPRISDPQGTFQADDFRFLTDYMDKEEEKILNLYVNTTGQDREKLKKYMKSETMLSAEDMVSLGFATKISESLKPIAYFKLNKNNMDENTVKTFGEKLDAIIAKIAGFSRLSTENMMIKDVNGNECKIDKATGEPAVGDKATPDGNFVMASGKTIVVAGGVITEIKDSTPSTLDLANAKIAELEAKVTAAEAFKSESETAKAAFEAQEVSAKALVTELTALKNTWKPTGRQNVNTENKVGSVDLNRVKEIITNTNSKN
jgi:ATP-dependent Clp protease protease subunit